MKESRLKNKLKVYTYSRKKVGKTVLNEIDDIEKRLNKIVDIINNKDKKA